MQDVAGIGIAASSRKVTESQSSGQLRCSAGKKKLDDYVLYITNLFLFGVTSKSRRTSDSASHPVSRAFQHSFYFKTCHAAEPSQSTYSTDVRKNTRDPENQSTTRMLLTFHSRNVRLTNLNQYYHGSCLVSQRLRKNRNSNLSPCLYRCLSRSRSQNTGQYLSQSQRAKA